MAWINSWLTSVGEVLAPSVQSSLEDFKAHWRIVRNYYIDGKYDVESFQLSALPEHLVSMITILIEEERLASESTFQPCLEYFMQNKIMETLCRLGEKNMPPGIRKLVLQTVTSLLSGMPQSILPNMGVHKAVSSLLSACISADDIEKAEFSLFLFTLVLQLRKEVHLIEFFLVETQSQDENKKSLELVPFKGLLQRYKDDGMSGEKSREGILLILQIESEPIRESIWKLSNLSDQLVRDLVEIYKSLDILKEGVSLNSDKYTRFKNHFSFCCAVINATIHEEKDTFVAKIEDEFLNTVLGPALLDMDDDAAYSAIVYSREMLLLINTPDLLKVFLTSLIGDATQPETEDEELMSFLRTNLIKRISSTNSRISLATLKLFSTMLGLFNKQIVVNLIVRNLLPCYHLELPEEPESPTNDSFMSPKPLLSLPPKNEYEELKSTIESYLTLLPSPQDAIVTYDAYLSDAEQLIYISQEATPWSQDEDLRPLNMQYFLFEDNELSGETDRFYGGGLFFTTVLSQLESMLENPFSRNLLLTGIFTKLAQYPIPSLYKFLLDKSLPVKPGVKTLWSVLSTLAEKVKQEESTMPNYFERLSKVRQKLTEDVPTPLENEDKKTFFEAVIVLEEFCKELAATWQIWSTHQQ